MALVLPLVLALAPLLITPGLLFYYDVTPKAVIILLGAAGLLPWLAGRSKELWSRPASRWLLILFAAQIGSLALSTVFSDQSALSLGGSNWRRSGLITSTAMLTVAASGLLVELRLLLRAIAASGLLVAVYGILQYCGIDPFLPTQSYHVGEGVWTIVRPPGTLGYVSYFAAYLVSVVFCGIALAWTDPGIWWRRLGAMSAGAGAVAIVLSGTRAAIAGLIVGAVIVLWNKRPAFRVFVAVLSLGVIFYFTPPGQKLRSRTRWYVEDPRGGPRLLLWRDAFRMGAVHPWTGFGPEAFATDFPRYQSADLARAYPHFYYESPHNIFLDAWTGQGVLGVLILLGICVSLRHSSSLPILASFAASLVVHLFTSFTLTTSLYFYTTAAILCGAGTRACHAETRLGARLRTVLPIPVSAFFLFLAIKLLLPDRTLKLVAAAIDAGDIPTAQSLYTTFDQSRLPSMTADLWLSRSLATASQKSKDVAERWRIWRAAFDAAERATRTAEDRHNAFYNLAVFCGMQNDFAGTERALRAAIQAAPNWFKPHWTLAQVLRAAGRLDEARAEAERAVDLNGGKDADVKRTLDELTRR